MTLVSVNTAVKVFRAGLAHDLDGRAHVAAILGGVIVGHNLDLGNRSHADGRREQSRPALAAAVLPVHGGVVPIQACARGGRREAPYVPSQRFGGTERIPGAAFAPLAHGNRVDSRQHSQHVHHVAPTGSQRVHLLVADQAGSVGALHANHLAPLCYGYRLHRHSKGQFQVAQSQSLTGCKRDAGKPEGLKTRLLDRQAVSSRLDRCKKEIPARR